MKVVLILAGLSIEAFDRVRAESERRFVPDGRLLVAPVKRFGYPLHDPPFLEQAKTYILTLPESERVCIGMAYVDYADPTTAAFVERFFPFALPRPVRPINFTGVTNKNTKAERLKHYVNYLVGESRTLIRKLAQVTEQTAVGNLTPLLLPLRNFRGEKFEEMLRRLYGQLGLADDPDAIIEEEIEGFLQDYPLHYSDSSKRHCFDDGSLLFKSPGKDRHGYYRYNRDRHPQASCLVNARSRLGGSYAHNFHFDCDPRRGKLAASYPDCHGEHRAPKKDTHVNIAPNDYVG